MKLTIDVPEPPAGYEYTGQWITPSYRDHWLSDQGKAHAGGDRWRRLLLRKLPTLCPHCGKDVNECKD